MTCIVGIVNNDGYIIGGDMLSSSLDDGLKSDAPPKVVDFPLWSVAYAGNFKIQRYIKEAGIGRRIKTTDDVWAFCKKLEACIGDDLVVVSEETDFKYFPTQLIVVSGQGLWWVQGDLTVFPVKTYCAAGVGMYTAIGALHYMQEYDTTTAAQTRLERALTISHQTTIQVGSEFWYREYKKIDGK